MDVLFTIYPPPANVRSENVPWRVRVESLRSWVHNILPAKSILPHNPEPESALEILGQNSAGVPHLRLCSKDAKLFSQYLAGIGVSSRIIQLSHHISVEVLNASTNGWEFQDPHFDDAIVYKGNYLSAIEAFDLKRKKIKFDYKGGMDVFDTVVIVPRANFASYKPFKLFGRDLDYFSYDNLAYWIPVRLTASSDRIWHDLFAQREKYILDRF